MEPNATFECRITPNPFLQNQFEACSSPHTYRNLPDGEYLFEVRAVNEYGIAGEIPAEWSFEVANPPDTTILAGPSGVVAQTPTTAFAFSSSEPSSEATFECFLDGVDLGECLSPALFPDVEMGFPEIGVGTHTFVVQAVDLDGNVDPTPATRTWTVIEATYPETTILSGPNDPTSATTATFDLESSVGGSTFRCALDGGTYAPCNDPHVISGLTVDSHVLQVEATDPDGNVDPTPAVYSWTVVEADTVAPVTRFDSGPTDPTNATDASFRFSAESGSTYMCSLDSGDFVHCTSPTGYFGLMSGPHTFSVRATDPSGNVEVTPATYTCTVDTAAPDTEITSHPGEPEPR